MTHSPLQPFVGCITGTSESSGRLSGWPDTLVGRLKRELQFQKEAVGPVILWDKGHGGWTSQDILNEAPDIAALRPNFILAESGDMNDSFVSSGVPVIARPQKIVNMRAAAAIWTAAIPGVDIVWRTANPVSTAVAVGRPNLPDYFADTLATATTDGFGTLDNAAAWPTPLPEAMCFGFDGLHPVWANAVEIYEYRAILFLFRQKMAAWWGLAAPVAAVYPTAPDINFCFIAGGGGGGDNIGGGGGAGGIRRGVDYAAAILGAFSIGAAGLAVGGARGTPGGDTTVGSYVAKGGGEGGYNAADLTASRGGDGGSSGGAGNHAIGHAPGTPRYGQGFQGGLSSAINGLGAGAGGGCTTPGADGGNDGGVAGLGWTTDVPGDPQQVCGGGPGGSTSGNRPAYGLGGGPTKFGGGGRGGGSLGAPGAGDNGGIGKGWIWYPGAARFAGGTITSSGGFTVHALTGSGTLV